MNMPYAFAEYCSVKYLSFPALDKTGLVKCVFSTRARGANPGGASPAPYDSLNLGFTTDDKVENVKKNRRQFSKIIPDAFQNKILQVHESIVIPVKKINKKDTILGVGDALTTNMKNIPLTVLVADCFVVYFLDPVNKAIGVAHCGWRGVIKNIVKEVFIKMNKEYGTEAPDCLTAISPGIGACCFLVDEDVHEEFKNTYPQWDDLYIKNETKWSIDLNKVILRLLLTEGVKNENIADAVLCTSCNKDLFYSYRRDKSDTGRMAATIVLL